ncbi:MAG: hypothetical protein H6839_03690 [Planctomycetes bacterium]|nr:hypothetical protein [Planctomycetota bacterium]
MGELDKVNQEVLAEVKALANQAKAIAVQYGLPCLEQLLVYLGVPSPFAKVITSSVKYAVDDLHNNNTENAELRALTAMSCVAHSKVAGDAYKQATPDRIRSLYQRVTKKATEIRQEDRVRVVIAATFGGSDEELATPEDLFAAEWLEHAPESKLTLLRDLCFDLFGPDVLERIIPRPKSLNAEQAMTATAPSPCAKVPTDVWIRDWNQKATLIWGQPPLVKDMFEGPPAQTFHYPNEPRTVAFRDYHAGVYKEWPRPLLQRIHNAFARSKQMMAFELKQSAGTDAGKPT